MSDDFTPVPPPPPEPTQPNPTVATPQANQPRLWKTWQLVTVSVVALLIGAGIGAAGSASDEEKKDATETSGASVSTVDETTTVEDESTTTAEATTTTEEPTTTTEPKPASYTIGDKVVYADGSSVQVFSFEQGVPGGDFDEPTEGNEFLVVDVEVCAGPDGEASYNTLGFETIMPDNRRWTNTFATAREPDLGAGDLPAGGGCVRGWATLETNAGVKPAAIVWTYWGEEARWQVP